MCLLSLANCSEAARVSLTLVAQWAKKPRETIAVSSHVVARNCAVDALRARLAAEMPVEARRAN